MDCMKEGDGIMGCHAKLGDTWVTVDCENCKFEVCEKDFENASHGLCQNCLEKHLDSLAKRRVFNGLGIA